MVSRRAICSILGAAAVAAPLAAAGPTIGETRADPPVQMCLMVMTVEDYEFTVTNRTDGSVTYTLGDMALELAPGEAFTHRVPKRRGTNSCNIETFSPPVLVFDESPFPGLQLRRYVVGDRPDEAFVPASFGIDLDR